MLLHTPLYLLFLAGVCALYWVLPWPAIRREWLLVASYVFYAAFDLRFAGLLLGLTLAAYTLGRLIPGSPRARLYAWLNVALSLGLLAVFKYAGFFLGSLAAALPALGVAAPPPALRLLLPVGISFYTFQSVSYTTEIYRGRAAPASRFGDFALYLAFFPKLLAGPFVRPALFLPQAAQPRRALSRPAVYSALSLLALGLVKKVLIADSLAGLADVAFRAAALPSGPLPFTSALYWQGFYLYAFQIYADFSGYTDIARASALLLGFDLPENFQQPYLSPTPAAFWNRWHMTLTQWFREYLFFPVSRWLSLATERRRPRLVQATATLLTMTLIGLWHGAGWTFVAWGLWHGVLLTLERLSGVKPAGRLPKIAAGLVSFHLVGLGWVLFRADTFAAAARFVRGMLAFDQMGWLINFLPPVLLAGGLIFALDALAAGLLPARLTGGLARWRPVWVTAGLVAVTGLTLLKLVNGGDARPFIYGQF